MRIMVCSIQLNMIHPHVASAMAIMLGAFGKKHPDDELILFTPQRVEIATGRNMAVNLALERECEYLFFLDDDTMCPPDTLDRLIKRLDENEDIYMIGPMYRVRGYPYKLMAFVPRKDGIGWELASEPYDIGDNGLIKCEAIGNGCTMVRTDIYRILIAAGDNNEWYRTGKFHTEDSYFCAKVQNIKPDMKCAVDTTFSADHMLGVTWINEDNLRWLRLKTRMVDAVMKDGKRLDDIEALVDGWNETTPLQDMAVLNYDGSIGRL